jgi:NADH-quinone oxidoreductase subunit I
MKVYFKHIYQAISTILIGMKITFRHMFQKRVTILYPEQKLQLPERERNRLFVNIDDCIGCEQCSKACPVSCIDIETIKAVPGDIIGKTGTTSEGKKKALFVTKFDIDFAKCCFCQLCVFPCPTSCIYMTDVYEYSVYNRKELLYSFSDMTPEQVEEKKKKAQDYAVEQARKKELVAKEAAEKKATTPKPKTVQKPVQTKSAEAPKPDAEAGNSEKKES